jgi:hypothetical protein
VHRATAAMWHTCVVSSSSNLFHVSSVMELCSSAPAWGLEAAGELLVEAAGVVTVIPIHCTHVRWGWPPAPLP